MKKVFAVVLVMVMMFCALPFGADAVFYNGIMENTRSAVWLSEEEPVGYRAFYAEKSGYYAFYSDCGTYSDPFVYCYDEDHNQLGYDDDTGGNQDFCYIAYLKEGEKYYFEMSAKKVDGAMYNVSITLIDNRVTQLSPGDTINVIPSHKRDAEFFKVVPDESGYYALCSQQKYAFTSAVLYDSDFKLLKEDDDSGVGSSFYLSYYLEKGKTYYYKCSTSHNYKENAYDVCFKPCAIICDINIVTYPDKMTYYNGYIDGTKNFTGLSAEFVYTDGTSVNWEYKDTDSYEYEVLGTTVYTDMSQDEDGQYYIYVAADDGYARFDVDVIDCPVESIEVVSHSKIECYENMTGYEYLNRETGERSFYYMYNLPPDIMIQINYVDGTSVQKNFLYEYDDMKFRHSDNQMEKNWTVGKNPVTIQYFDKECTLYVDVLENPIESLVLKKAPSTIYIFTNTSDDENAEHYEFTPNNLTGIELEVNYKDDTKELLTGEDFRFDNGGTLGDYRFYTGTYSVDKPQKVLVALRYCGHKVFYEATVTRKGDVDLDFAVSVMDATKIQKMIVNNETISSQTKKLAEMDYDGAITVLDATKIQRIVAGFSN